MSHDCAKFWFCVGSEDVEFELCKDIVHAFSSVLKEEGCSHLTTKYKIQHIQSFVNFMYGLNYRFGEAVVGMRNYGHTIVGSTAPLSTSDINRAHVDGSAAVYHLEMYALADEFKIQELAALSLDKFWECIREHTLTPAALPKVLAAAYEHSEDAELHHTLVNIVLGRREEVIIEDDDVAPNRTLVPWDVVVQILTSSVQDQEENEGPGMPTLAESNREEWNAVSEIFTLAESNTEAWGELSEILTSAESNTWEQDNEP